MPGATYNITRFTRQVLKRYRKEPPSLVLHLFNNYFRFEKQHGTFAYDSHLKCLLEAIREQTLPTDLLQLFEQADVRYYEGCLIVEVHDHRDGMGSGTPNTTAQNGQPSAANSGLSSSLSKSFQVGRASQPAPQTKAEVYRIVLAPTSASLWTEIGLLENRLAHKIDSDDELAENQEKNQNSPQRNSGWNLEQAIEIESIILARTAPPLCLSPSLQTTRIANSLLRATTLRPPKRKRFCHSAGNESDDAAESGQETAKREKEEFERMMKLGEESVQRGRSHAFTRLNFIQQFRNNQTNPPTAAAAASTATPTTIRLTQPQPITSSTSTPVPSAQSPPAPNTGPIRSHKTKNSIAGDANSEMGTPAATPAGNGNVPLTKKERKALAQAQIDANDPTLPTDPAEREQELERRRKEAQRKKKAEAKLKKERKAQQAQQQQDLEVSMIPVTQASPDYTWATGTQY